MIIKTNLGQDILIDDEDFHRFWEIPKCSCVVLDNIDSWGTKYNYINQDCLIHGD